MVRFLSPEGIGAKNLGRGSPTLSQYYVYIMSSYKGTLYTGVTNDLERRVYEHRHKLVPGFTKKYNVSRLVYWQASESLESARAREKEIKGWRRSKKVELIEELNPYWSDLAHVWTKDSQPPQALRPDQNRDSGNHREEPAHGV